MCETCLGSFRGFVRVMRRRAELLAAGVALLSAPELKKVEELRRLEAERERETAAEDDEELKRIEAVTRSLRIRRARIEAEARGMARPEGVAAYCVGTWDETRQRYTPQVDIRPWFNLTLGELREHLKALRRCGYSAHRTLDEKGGDHSDNDWSVLVELVGGRTAWEVYKEWVR